ncbi:hypothetical protein H310_03929 [Aphanomyces invadans]|uniref:Uncharacterized protein n=1 Tax=Aphanomyces invadans TaxID=157072 RepID=A0A024UFY3_9STRA|nr:hypothetical protein H310_03929 [Aphanomyces invadans]ETW04792.1 hypothetical protein H310_03929 [Aphanomyces invadans]|eukprot:XP_008866230.1 hypothetical protein H310_03929 [Aphanomyces invadans]
MGVPSDAGGGANAAGGSVLDHDELEALSQSHKVLEQAYSVDSKSPDLVDQIADHSEPTSHNYFFEPYSNAAGGWQPQLVHTQKLLPYPVAITSAYENMRSGSFSGLLQEIHHAWVSVDSTLFLWDYTRAERFVAFDGIDQTISAVAIAKPIPGVFKAFVKHVLVVATASDMRLLPVLYEHNDPVHGAIRLQPTKLCISTDDVTVKKIVSTADGRIFFGGSDGHLHEFIYDATEGVWHQLGWKRKCRKESHSQSLSTYIPSIFRSLTGALTSAHGKIVDMTVDAERHILYVTQAPATIHVYDLYPAGEIKLVASKDLHAEAARFCQRNHRTWTSCPEPRLFTNNATSSITLTALSIVGRDESASIHAVAVSSTGIRFYLSTFTPGFFSSSTSSATKRPDRIDLMHIRLPPPMLSLEDAPEYHVTEGLAPAILTGKSPSYVHKALYRKGVFLAIDGGPDTFDSVVGLCQDSTARHNQDSVKRPMRESISSESCQGKVSDVQELVAPRAAPATPAVVAQAGTKRTFSDMQSNGGAVATTTSEEPHDAMLSELVTQFFQPTRRFMVLTNAGLHTFQKVRPIDHLVHILQTNPTPGKELTAKLTHFVKCFGRAETCAMLFVIATGEPRAYTMVALQSIFEFGGQPGVSGSPSPSAGGVNGGNHSNRFILTDDMCMSYHHDGLVKFLARILRPFWTAHHPGLPDGKDRAAALDHVRVVLFRLQSILATQYASAVSHPATTLSEPSRFNTLTRTLNSMLYETNPASLREENAIRAEQFSIRCLYRFTIRALETMSLLVAIAETTHATGTPLPLAELVTTTTGAAACKALIQKLMADAGHSEALVHQLHDECPLLFTDTDAAECHGFQALDAADTCVTAHDQQVVLSKAMDHFRLACKAWKTEAQLSVLELICKRFFQFGYLDGIVELCLACARQLSKPDLAPLRRAAYSGIVQTIHYLTETAANGLDLPMCANSNGLWTDATQREAAVDRVLSLVLASPDSQLHMIVLTWLYEHGQHKRLVALMSPHAEAFLKAKDEELLVKQYLVQERYVDAAHVLWTRAQAFNPTSAIESNRTIDQRVELMSRAASTLAASHNPAALHALAEVRESLDVLQLQHNIWKSLDKLGIQASALQDLKYRVVDVSTLYNQFAFKHSLWGDCLRIIRTCNTEDASTIQHLWERLLFSLVPQSAGNVSFNQWISTKHGTADAAANTSSHVFESAVWISHIQAQLAPLGKELVASPAFPVEFLVHELEHLWMWFIQLTRYTTPQSSWIASFMIDCGVPMAQLFGVYYKLYDANEAPRWRFHLLRGIFDLVTTWQRHVQASPPSSEAALDFATAAPLLLSACEAFVVDLHALVGDGHAHKHSTIARFRQLKADVAITRSKYT